MNNKGCIYLVAGAVFLVGVYSFIRKSSNQAICTRTVTSTIIVGTDAGYPPFEFIENNTIMGFDIDLMREIGKRLDKTIELKNMAFDGLIIQLQSNGIDVIAAGMSPTPERAKKVDFTLPYLEPSPYAVVVKKGKDSIMSIDDLKNKVVAVNQGFTADMAISQIDEIIPMRLASSMTSDGILAVQSGRADAFIANKTTIIPFLKTELSKEFDVYMVHDKAEATALAVAKQSCFLDEINKTITDMKNDGTLEQLKQKWGI